MSFGVLNPEAAQTHTPISILHSPGLLTRMRELAPQLEKGVTSAQHELRACTRRPRGRRGQDCHITDVIQLTQASRDSRSILENVYDVSNSRHGIEEAFLPCKAPLLFRAAPVLYRPIVIVGHPTEKIASMCTTALAYSVYVAVINRRPRDRIVMPISILPLPKTRDASV